MKADDSRLPLAALALAALFGCATGGPAPNQAHHIARQPEPQAAKHEDSPGAHMGMGDMKAMCEMHGKMMGGDMKAMSPARHKQMLEMQERCK